MWHTHKVVGGNGCTSCVAQAALHKSPTCARVFLAPATSPDVALRGDVRWGDWVGRWKEMLGPGRSITRWFVGVWGGRYVVLR